MGARGALAKDDSRDYRPRTTAQAALISWTDVPAKSNLPVPDMPYNGAELWGSYAKDIWHRLWSHGLSTLWDRESDLDAVARYCELHDRAQVTGEWNGPMLNAASQLSDKLGLSPHARQRMYIRIKPADDAVPVMDNTHLAAVEPIRKEELR